jgi:hypothetical protein
MPAILLSAQRHDKSSRGTPRLRCPPETLHGAMRLAALPAALHLTSRKPVDAQFPDRPALTLLSSVQGTPDSSRRPHPVAASGGFLECLDWPALALALTKFRLFMPKLRCIP